MTGIGTLPTCRIAGCTKDAKEAYEGMCWGHYRRWGNCGYPPVEDYIAAGGPGSKEWEQMQEREEEAERVDVDEKYCPVPGCVAAQSVDGLCVEHAGRWTRCGMPEGRAYEAWLRAAGPDAERWAELDEDGKIPPSVEPAGAGADLVPSQYDRHERDAELEHRGGQPPTAALGRIAGELGGTEMHVNTRGGEAPPGALAEAEREAEAPDDGPRPALGPRDDRPHCEEPPLPAAWKIDTTHFDPEGPLYIGRIGQMLSVFTARGRVLNQIPLSEL